MVTFKLTSERVPVSRDQDLLAVLDLRHDRLVPVGQRALDRQLQRLEHGELGRGGPVLAGVPGVLDDVRVVRVVRLHGGRGHVEGAAPDLDLLLAYKRFACWPLYKSIFFFLEVGSTVLGGGLGLVEAGEGAVVTLVQPPSLADGQVRLVNALQDLN